LYRFLFPRQFVSGKSVDADEVVLAGELQSLLQERTIMLHWTLVFLVIALIAALLGFGGIAGAAAGIAKILFFVFLVIWLLSFLRRSV
jgi:uncharacterized membrane protein YtjA (UPF0391 family)